MSIVMHQSVETCDHFDRKSVKEQPEIDILLKYAVRLAEERSRVQPHQGRFAEKIGISQGKQSLYEKGKRELRADYLEEVAGAGLDVQYIVTGERSATKLPPDANELLTLYLRLDNRLRDMVLQQARSLYDYLAREEGVPPAPAETPPLAGGMYERAAQDEAATLHDKRPGFRSDDG